MPERVINTKSATGFLLILIPAALTMSALFVAWPIILGATVLIVSGNLWQNNQWMKTARSIDPVFQQLVIQNRGEITPLDLSLNAKISGATSNRYLAAKADEFGTGSRQHPDRGRIYYFISPSTLGAIFDDSEREVPEIMPATTPVATIPVAVAAPAAIAEVANPTPPAPVETPPAAASIPISAPVPAETSAAPESVAESMQIDESPAPAAASPLSGLARLLDEKDSPTSEPISSNQEVERPIDPIVAAPAEDLPLVTIVQSELAKRLDVHSSTVYKRRSEPNFTDWTRNRDPEGIGWAYTDKTKEYYRVDT
jgi:hypothetical protein